MRKRRGSAFVEFTLVSIPLMFVLISIFEIGRGMWNFHTLAEATKEGARWAIVNGGNCSDTGNSCSCPVPSGSTAPGNSIDCIAHTIAAAAIGLPPSTLNVTINIISSGGNSSVTCNPLSSCYGGTNTTALTEGIGSEVKINSQYQYQSALALFWPGTKAVSFGAITFYANARQLVQY